MKINLVIDVFQNKGFLGTVIAEEDNLPVNLVKDFKGDGDYLSVIGEYFNEWGENDIDYYYDLYCIPN